MQETGKKVLFLVNHDVVIYNFRLELVERLLSDGYEVHISSPYGERIDDLVRLGAEYHEIKVDRHGMNPVKEILLLKQYRKLMSSIHPDVIFAYTVKPNIYGGIAARKEHVPFIATVTGLGTSVENGGIKACLVLWLYRLGMRYASMVYFQNRANMNFMLQKGVVSAAYGLLPGSGVNLLQHCFEPYPGDTDEIVFITIGRIMKDKGTDELLKAAEILKRKYPRIKFQMAGFFDGDYKEIIRQAVNAGTVEYISQQKDIHPFIAESHAIIHPSHHEGMSNVLLEAAATGRPVLASDIPGCRETFDEGKSGFGFRPKDAADLACTIEKFILLPYEKKVQMGMAGRKKMEKEFDRRNVVETYMKEVEKIMEEKETCSHSCTKN